MVVGMFSYRCVLQTMLSKWTVMKTRPFRVLAVNFSLFEKSNFIYSKSNRYPLILAQQIFSLFLCEDQMFITLHQNVSPCNKHPHKKTTSLIRIMFNAGLINTNHNPPRR